MTNSYPVKAIVPSTRYAVTGSVRMPRARDYAAFNKVLHALIKVAAKDKTAPRCTQHPDCLEDAELAIHCMGQQITAGTWRDPA